MINREDLINYWSYEIYEGKMNMDWVSLKESCWCCISPSYKEILINDSMPKTCENLFLLCDECSSDFNQQKINNSNFSEVEWLINHKATNYHGTNRSHLLANLYIQNELTQKLDILYNETDSYVLKSLLYSFLKNVELINKGYFYSFEGYKTIFNEIINNFNKYRFVN